MKKLLLLTEENADRKSFYIGWGNTCLHTEYGYLNYEEYGYLNWGYLI
jgi:hypothetical protein